MVCGLMMLLALNSPGMPDSSRDLVPPAWTLPAAQLRTRGAHEHEWIEGPRGGVFYWSSRGTKVYQKRR